MSDAEARQRATAGRSLPRGTRLLLLLILLAGAVPILIPFLWMVSTSLKARELAGELPPRWLPERERVYLREGGRRIEVLALVERPDGTTKIHMPNGVTAAVRSRELHRVRRIESQWSNYSRLLAPKRAAGDDDFARFLLNTLLIAGMTVIGQVLSSSLVGWGFARLRFAGKELLFMLMLATMMIPGQIGMIPVFIIFRWLGWIDTFLPLIVPAWFGSAFFAFLYRQYFMRIPLEMDEAATLDGCSPGRTYWSILLPMAKPVTVTVAVFTFLGAWNDFLGPLM